MQNSLKMKIAFTAIIMVLLCQTWQSGVYACGNIRLLCKKEWDTCAVPSTISGMINAVKKFYIHVCCRVILGLGPSETGMPQSHRRSVTEESTEMRGDLRAFSSGTRQEPINQDSSTDSKSNTESSEAAGVCNQLLSECKRHVTATEISTYLHRVEPEISFTSAFSDLVDPMLEMVGQTNSRDSILGLILESPSETSSDIETNVEVPIAAVPNETEIPMAQRTTRANERECVEDPSQDSSVTELHTVSEGTDKVDGKVKHEQVGQTNPRYSNVIFVHSDLEIGSVPEGEADSRDPNLELHIHIPKAASIESETDVKIPFHTGTDEIESYTNLNTAYTDEREGGDHFRRQHGYSSVTVPKELNFVAESNHQNAFSRGEPDGHSSYDASATAPSVPTWSVVTADEYRERRRYRHRYTEEWLTYNCPSSMEVMFNSSSNMNDNQTSLHDSIDTDELFGSGQG